MELDVDERGSVVLGLQALDAALRRHFSATRSRDNAVVYGAAAEALWWIAALDEQFSASAQGAYRKQRDGDTEFRDGLYVAGLVWLRHRHSHQLPLTTAQDVGSFFQPGGSPPFYISTGYVWRAVPDLPPAPKDHARKQGYKIGLAAYERYCALSPTSGSILHARELAPAVVRG